MIDDETRKHRLRVRKIIASFLTGIIVVGVFGVIGIRIGCRDEPALAKGDSNHTDDRKDSTPEEPEEKPPLSFDWHEHEAPECDGKMHRGLSSELSTSPGKQLYDGNPSPIASHPAWIKDYWLFYGTFEKDDMKYVMVVRDRKISEATPLKQGGVGMSDHTQHYSCAKRPIRMFAGYVHKSIKPEEIIINPPPELIEFMQTHR